MLSYFEGLEDQFLADYAVKSKSSKGRRYKEPSSLTRTCFQRDRDRVIHSKAFRRLKHKTQVFIATESDHYRSRLTHSLEVAQISRHISRLLRVNEDLSEALALAHDLGHTPFGHSGERELNNLMKEFGGFEHNLQSKRIVDELEQRYPNFPGLNLSYEVSQGLLKHSTPYDNPKDADSGFTCLEMQLCNLADEIAYNNHDLDDGVSAGILDESELEKHVTLWRDAKKTIQKQHSGLSPEELKYLINSHLISSQIINVVQHSQKTLKAHKIKTLDDVQRYGKTLISFDKEMQEKNKELRKYLFKTFYSHVTVYRMNKKGQLIIRGLFEAFNTDHKLLPSDYQEQLKTHDSKERLIADYIAGMTDTFALKEYQSIYSS